MKRKQRLPVFLEPEEYAKLIRRPNKYSPTGLRNLCMLRIMAECGLRSSEVIDMNCGPEAFTGPNSLDLDTGRMIVRGKGDKDRLVVVNADLLKLIKKWIEKRPAATRLFCTLDGDELDPRYLRQMVKRYGVKAKLKKDIHPHVLRHTFATLFLRQTKNLRALQKILGHSRLTTTEIYTHIVDEEIENAMKEFKI